MLGSWTAREGKLRHHWTYPSPDLRLGFGHPQTLRIQEAMLTSCDMMLVIQGCSRSSLGIGRAFGSRVSLLMSQSWCLVSMLRGRSWRAHLRDFDKVLHFGTVRYLFFRIIFKFWGLRVQVCEDCCGKVEVTSTVDEHGRSKGQRKEDEPHSE